MNVIFFRLGMWLLKIGDGSARMRRCGVSADILDQKNPRLEVFEFFFPERYFGERYFRKILVVRPLPMLSKKCRPFFAKKGPTNFRTTVLDYPLLILWGNLKV